MCWDWRTWPRGVLPITTDDRPVFADGSCTILTQCGEPDGGQLPLEKTSRDLTPSEAWRTPLRHRSRSELEGRRRGPRGGMLAYASWSPLEPLEWRRLTGACRRTSPVATGSSASSAEAEWRSCSW